MPPKSDPNRLATPENTEKSSSSESRSPSPSPGEKTRKPSKSPIRRLLDSAQSLAKRKAAKSGNKQKQKEVNAECDKLEKDLDERHRLELAASAAATKTDDVIKTEEEATPTQAPPPSDQIEGSDEEGITSKFYKNLKISSKSAKKQAKKKEQEEKMKAAAAADKEAAKRTDTEKHLEKTTIKGMLNEDRLKMIDIPADGDCMYNALVHQLQEENIEVSVRKLRKHAAQYMRDHKDEFAPFIADSDFAGGAGPDADSDWDTYLLGVEQCAEVGGVWGGELELKAVSKLYQKTIVVYRESGKYQIGDEFSSPADRALRIVYLQKAYHLGEHYNSTCYA